MKILVVSDAHVDRITAGFPRWGDVERAMLDAVGIARERRADLFAFLGDWCNPGNLAPRAAALMIEIFATLERDGIAVVAIPGNHDVIEDGSGSSTLSPVRAYLGARADVHGGASAVFERPSVIFREHPIVFLPYVPRSHAYDPAEFIRNVDVRCPEEPKRVIVFGHLDPPGMFRGSEATEMARGREMVWPVNAILERWGNRALMIGGHIHRPGTYGGVHIVGSIIPLSFAEEGIETGCLFVEVA